MHIQQLQSYPSMFFCYNSLLNTGGVVTGNNVDAVCPGGGQRCCPRPQRSPSEQHMLTMISKDVCWAVSKAVASLSSSLPLWTKKKNKTSNHVSQHPSETMTVCTVITQSSAAQHGDSCLQMHSNISNWTFCSVMQVKPAL